MRSLLPAAACAELGAAARRPLLPLATAENEEKFRKRRRKRRRRKRRRKRRRSKKEQPLWFGGCFLAWADRFE